MSRFRVLLKLTALLLITYTLLRLIFIAIYAPGRLGMITDLPLTLFWGLRLDIAALVYVNLLFLLYFIFISPWLRDPWSPRLTIVLFCLSNLPFIALNVIDLVYFGFNARRSTIDILYSFTESTNSFGGLLIRYWYVVVAFIVLCYVFYRATRTFVYGKSLPWGERSLKYYLVGTVVMLISVVSARGWDSRPIGPSTPLLYFHPSAQPSVNNSTLNFLYSVIRFRTNLDRKAFFAEATLDSVYSIRRDYSNGKPMDKRNVVVFLLESMNESFFTGSNQKAYTPFLDSLRSVSTVCTNAYQNGHESVKGALAALASIPPFTEEPMFISNYAAVPLEGIGELLARQGYSTNFYLGAEYDHFNFAKLCRMVGIRNYISKENITGQFEDDGHWGVYDEYFMDFFARETRRASQPFFSVFYNISTHPPFSIPPSRKKDFKIKGQDDQQNSVTYLDDCLRRLFADPANQEWIRQTLFVFIADHSLPPYNESRSSMYTAMQIPFFVYDPANPRGDTITRTVQQLDLVPTILHQLNYPLPFMSFGHSIHDSLASFSISRTNGAYQVIDGNYITGIDEAGRRVLYHYDLTRDMELANNLAANKDAASTKALLRVRAILQRFNNSLLDNDLRIK